MSFFDKFYELAVSDRAKETKPFWTVDQEDEEAIVKWMNQTSDTLKQYSKFRVYNMRRNLAAYRGIQFKSQSTRGGDSERDNKDDVKKSKNPRIVLNHLLDMVEQHVSKTTKYRPAVASVAASDDLIDTNVAKISDDLIENFWTKNTFDDLMQKHTRIKRICGESYIFVLWDEKKGPYDKDWLGEVFSRNGIEADLKKLTKSQINVLLRKVKSWPKIELKDDQGVAVTSSKGDPLVIDAPVRVGEVINKLVMPWRVYLQRQDDEREVEYVMYSELVHIDDLKAEHPDKAREFDSVKPTEEFDAATLNMERTQDTIEVIHFYHKTTSKLDRGKYVKFCRETVLINKDNPYEGPYGRVLPFDRLTDLNPPGTVDADALTTHGIPAQHLYNINISMDARNRFLFAHPKWFTPQGAVKAESLANSTSVVQYKGAQPPVLSQPNLGNVDNMKKEAKEDLQQIMGVFGVSRGQPPPGIKAGVALQFLDEQENERENLAIAKHNASIKNVARQTIALMGQKYADTEGRLADILGRTRAAEIESFTFADLNSIDDVELQNSSALPTQKSARIQTLMDLSERYPGEVDGRQVLDMIGMGQSDKFVNLSTIAVRGAEQENERLLRVGNIEEVKKYEDHLMHYYIHMALVNDPSLNRYLSKERKDELELHMQQHEMFMFEIMLKNPGYAEQVYMKYPSFPNFLAEELLPEPLPPVASNTGEVIPMEGMPIVPQDQQFALADTASPVSPDPVAMDATSVPGEVL